MCNVILYLHWAHVDMLADLISRRSATGYFFTRGKVSADHLESEIVVKEMREEGLCDFS